MEKRKRIILTMLELVVEQGVHATPMSQVAKEANVAVGTIYHYFENKNQIIEEIYSMICQDYGVVLMANVPETGFKDQFETMWINLFNYFTGNPLAFKFMEFIGVTPIITEEIRLKNIVHFSNIRDFILEGIKNKDLKDVDLRLMMQMMFGSVISVARLKYKNELPMNRKQINDAFMMTWDCVRYAK